jgi:putative thioredoxin
MGQSIEVSQENFATEVVERSHRQPVLVDFYAQWCGPCQLLKPMLEKLAQEYDFTLAKVDIDRDPELAGAYGVQGVPDVKVCLDGTMQEGFVGVLPDDQLRQWLASLNLKSKVETGLEAIAALKAAGDLEGAVAQLTELRQHYPTHRQLMLESARLFIEMEQFEEVEAALAPIQERERDAYAQANALRQFVQLKRNCQDILVESELDERFVKACHLAVTGQSEAALQIFLQIVERDRKYRNDGARKAAIAVFDYLGSTHPLTLQYRKLLTAILL